MRTLFIILYIILTLPIADARKVLILHTNDLHSYFTGYHNGKGGYAKLLTKIKMLRADAEARGIDVLQVDAGDWGDGTSFYLSDEGRDSIRAIELLGAEIAAIGNHDHMIGGKVLGEQINNSGVATKFVAANLKPTADMELSEVIQPYVDVEKGGIKIRVIGLTTDSNLYEYSMRPGSIADPIYVGEREARQGKKSGKELVIALTHIGLTEDRLLARQSSAIDVIVGAHSHSRLQRIVWEKNERNQNIPIVQAHAHGLGVGALLLDISHRGSVRVLNYRLHQINSSLDEDPEMNSFIEESIAKRNSLFDGAWNEVIGESHTFLSGNLNGENNWRTTCWGRHVAKATREAVGAEVGFHIAGFAGVYRPAGPIRLGDIIDNQPHVRSFADPGWEIATVLLPGWMLRPFMYVVGKIGYGVDLSGLGFKSVDQAQTYALYRVAFPAEIAQAINGSLPFFKKYLRDLQYTGQYLWPVLTEYVSANSPIRCQ